jgi:hypothetical protein
VSFAPASIPAPQQQPRGVTPLSPLHATPLVQPAEPRPLPPALQPQPAQTQPTPIDGLPLPDPNVVLPQKENLTKLDVNGLMARRGYDRWQIAAGYKVFREFNGDSQTDAEELVRLLRDMRPTEWGVIGTGRPVVEYGVYNGKAQTPSFTPKTAVSIDPRTVRVESVRGVWVLRDDENILLNFGKVKEDAEQAIGVIRKYAFNRLAQVGPAAGGVTLLFAQEVRAAAKGSGANPYAGLVQAYQEQQLTRSGVDVPAANGAGEKISIDPKAVEIRREKGNWVLAHGPEVLADFGPSEWSARDALKLVQEQRFTEFVRFTPEVTFFLVNGQAPTRVPFAVQAVRFDKETLAVKTASNGKFGVYEGMGRQLFGCDTEKEAKQLVAVLQHYGFDTSCQMGLSAKASLRFLAKTGR